MGFLYFIVERKKPQPQTMAPAKTATKKAKQPKSASQGDSKRRTKAKDQSRGVTNGSIRRLARRGGCKRLASNVYEQARQLLKNFVSSVMGDTHALMDVNQERPAKTVSVQHVLYALRKRGCTMYVSA